MPLQVPLLHVLDHHLPGSRRRRRAPAGTASSGSASSASPSRSVGRPDGNEQQGLEAGFEQKDGRKRLDVFAHVDSLRVALEGLSGFHRRAQAITPTPAAPETHHRSAPVF